MGPAPRHPWAAARPRTRQRHARPAGRGPGDGAEEPQAGPRGRRSARRAAALPGRTQLRRSGRAGPGAEAGRLAQRETRKGLDVEPPAVRLPAHRQSGGLGGDERRCARGPHPDLVHEGAHGPGRAAAHPLSAGVGDGDGVPHRQPLRPAPARARPPEPRDTAHAGPAAPGGRGGHRGRARIGGPRGRRSTTTRACGRCPRRA